MPGTDPWHRPSRTASRPRGDLHPLCNHVPVMLSDPFPPSLPRGWASRVPIESDVPVIADLVLADRRRTDPKATVDLARLESVLVGLRSWSRRQVVVLPAGAAADAPPVAWIACVDRAAGRTDVEWVLADSIADRDAVAAVLFAWAVEVAGSFARHRGVPESLLDTSVAEGDVARTSLLARNGYQKVRTWLHMRRPVTPEEATTTPDPREGVRVRRVHEHPSGMPLAQDVRTVHRMLEESFADHFNSYRESFPEFAARLTGEREVHWDHWWIAEVRQEDGSWWPAGGLVCSEKPATGDAPEGTYLDYLGVHRSARGRGVAKALLCAAIRDAAERGRGYCELEVDADSPTGADGLYASMGFESRSRTESWHSSAPAHPSRLLERSERY